MAEIVNVNGQHIVKITREDTFNAYMHMFHDANFANKSVERIFHNTSDWFERLDCSPEHINDPHWIVLSALMKISGKFS